MAIRLRFDLEPARALAFFRRKGLQTSFRWQDMLHEAHDQAFTVAALMDVSLLRDVRQAVDDAIAQGTTLREFRARLKPLLVERGWWGRAELIDPATGEIRMAQLGSPRRLQTIFRVNLRTSYAAGHWSQIVENAAQAPFLLYDAVLDERTRQDHRAWDGTVLRVDDEWWRTHYPPNGWNCRCSVIQLDERQLRELGKSAPDPTPQGGSRPWTNPQTGEVVQVPDGIDPGWGYHPGRAQVDKLLGQLRDQAVAAPDIAAPVLARVAQESRRQPALFSRANQVLSYSPKITQDAIEAQLGQLPGQAQVAKWREFLDAHPQQLLVVQPTALSPNSQAARRIADEVLAFLPEPVRRFGQRNYTIRGGPKAADGFTHSSYEHVVLQAKKGDALLDGEAGLLVAAVRRALRKEGDWRQAVERSATATGRERFPRDTRSWTFSVEVSEDAPELGRKSSKLGAFVHELAHQIHFWAGSPARPEGAGAITRYAGTNKYEWHAEHLSAWLVDREALREWDPQVVAHLDQVVERAIARTEK